MARMEIITGGERRRRWSDEEKYQVLAEADAFGVKISEVARRYDILPQQIRRWRKELLEPKAPVPVTSFVPVSLTDGASTDVLHTARTPKRSATVEIALRNGRVLKVPADLERSSLASLIACVEVA
ncbi:IS66-like element accessory protein TnpA [Asticcacaulis sp.]|uniref:IS66-like element accessory protein TnpA n=1 Tax=Asticcacaulis sp. TaxID=1872648 RepID=UPI002B805C21|nr:transposase [Asticcacaulis sp.]HTM82798.1 transposase [Asticcacaulis sp.]